MRLVSTSVNAAANVLVSKLVNARENVRERAGETSADELACGTCERRHVRTSRANVAANALCGIAADGRCGIAADGQCGVGVRRPVTCSIRTNSNRHGRPMRHRRVRRQAKANVTPANASVDELVTIPIARTRSGRDQALG